MTKFNQLHRLIYTFIRRHIRIEDDVCDFRGCG